jgi:hypothetical protein
MPGESIAHGAQILAAQQPRVKNRSCKSYRTYYSRFLTLFDFRLRV